MNIVNEDVIISFAKPKYLGEKNNYKLGENLNKREKSIIVGYVQQMNLAQRRQVSKFFEIGNEEYDMTTSKVMSNLQINSVLLDGPSIMKYVAYALYSGDIERAENDNDIKSPIDHFKASNPDVYYNEQYAALIERVADDMGYIDYERGGPNSNSKYIDNSGWGATPEYDIPGTSDFWINLTSGLFKQPIGIYLDIYQKGSNGKKYKYGGVFLENCIISTHNLSTQANSRILSENLMIEVGRIVPCIGYGGYDISKIEHYKQSERIEGVFK